MLKFIVYLFNDSILSYARYVFTFYTSFHLSNTIKTNLPTKLCSYNRRDCLLCQNKQLFLRSIQENTTAATQNNLNSRASSLSFHFFTFRNTCPYIFCMLLRRLYALLIWINISKFKQYCSVFLGGILENAKFTIISGLPPAQPI